MRLIVVNFALFRQVNLFQSTVNLLRLVMLDLSISPDSAVSMTAKVERSPGVKGPGPGPAAAPPLQNKKVCAHSVSTLLADIQAEFQRGETEKENTLIEREQQGTNLETLVMKCTLRKSNKVRFHLSQTQLGGIF